MDDEARVIVRVETRPEICPRDDDEKFEDQGFAGRIGTWVSIPSHRCPSTPSPRRSPNRDSAYDSLSSPGGSSTCSGPTQKPDPRTAVLVSPPGPSGTWHANSGHHLRRHRSKCTEPGTTLKRDPGTTSSRAAGSKVSSSSGSAASTLLRPLPDAPPLSASVPANRTKLKKGHNLWLLLHLRCMYGVKL